MTSSPLSGPDPGGPTDMPELSEKEIQALTGRIRRSLEGQAARRGGEHAYLIERILARTTRAAPEAPPWGQVLREGMGHSRIMRLVAASLVVHIAAIPLCAWWAYKEPPPRLLIRIDPPVADALGEPASGGEGPLTAEAPDRLRTIDEPEEVERSLRLARFALSSFRAPAYSGLDSTMRGIPELLRLRAHLLSDPGPANRADVLLEAANPALLHNAGPVERSLLAEVQLDLLVLTGRTPDGLPGLLLGLREDVRRLHPQGEAPQPTPASGYALACAALDRASAYGLGLGSGSPCSRSASPLDACWFQLLEEALPADVRADPVVSSWLRTKPTGR